MLVNVKKYCESEKLLINAQNVFNNTFLGISLSKSHLRKKQNDNLNLILRFDEFYGVLKRAV